MFKMHTTKIYGLLITPIRHVSQMTRNYSKLISTESISTASIVISCYI